MEAFEDMPGGVGMVATGRTMMGMAASSSGR